VRSLHSDDAATPAPSLSGLTTTAKALYSVLLWQMTERPLIVVVDGNNEAEALYQSLATFYNLLVSASDATVRSPYPRSTPCPCRTCRRTPRSASSAPSALWRWPRRVPITVMPVASALLRLEPPDFYRQLALTLRRRRTTARRRSGAPGEHRLRAARSGGNGG
jgi:transcription-repair coupling factor (superfamily II helicase)